MGLPGKRLAKTRGRKRRGAIRLAKKTVNMCAKCKHPVQPHHACAFCGTYKNREVLKIKFKHLKKKEKEAKKKTQK
jgi:large subunit ribosomal protein L32